MIFVQLFTTFFIIGLFTIGGGYAMLSLIQAQVVSVHGWIDEKTFTDIVAISQMTPGPIGINSATYIGYKVTGNIWGSALATVAVCIPSFILVLLVGRYLLRNRENIYVKAIFNALRPIVVGLIGSAALLLMNKENFPDYTISVAICVASFVLVRYAKLHPILIIILAGISGLILY